MVIAQDAKEVDDLAILVVVSLDRRWFTIDKHGCGPAENVAKVLRFGQQWKKPIKVTVLPSVPSESDLFGAFSHVQL